MFARRALTAAAAVAGLVLPVASPAFAISRSPDPSSTAAGRVEASVQVGAALYIGGQFLAVDGLARTRLAALDAATGLLDPTFDVPVNGEVTALAASGTTLYVAGKFTTVGSLTRKNLAAVDTTTGAVLPFNVSPSSTVQSIDVRDGVAYLGGNFLKVNGAARQYLAAVDAATGQLVSGFSPQPSAPVYAVKATAAGIYAGGNFQTIGGVPRSYVARLDSDGAVQSWDAGLGSDSQVFDVAADTGHVYLATGGHLPAGNSLYGVDATTGAHEWQVQTDGNFQTVEAVAGTIYAGGHFNFLKPCIAGVCSETDGRKKALAVDTAGTVLSWAPRFNTALGVWDMTAAGGNLYVLGDFTTVNGSSQARIARFVL